MNYLEIADTYDMQADLLMSLIDKTSLDQQSTVAFALDLRVKAEDARTQHRYTERREIEHEQRLKSDQFDQQLRQQWLEVEKRKATALEALANAWGKVGELKEGQVIPFGPRGTEVVE